MTPALSARISWHVSDCKKEFPRLDCKDYRFMNMQRRQRANNARCYKTFHIPQFHTLYRGNSTKNRRQVVGRETSRIPQTNPRTLIHKIQSPIHICTEAQQPPVVPSQLTASVSPTALGGGANNHLWTTVFCVSMRWSLNLGAPLL